MGYKQILHKDSTKHERVWLRTDHFHELFIPDPATLNYIDVSHLSDLFAQPLIVLFAGYGYWYTGAALTRHTQTNVLGIEFVRSGDLILTQGPQEMPAVAGEVYFIRGDFPDRDRTGPAGIMAKRYVWLTGVVLENLLRSLQLWNKRVFSVPRPRAFEALLRQMTNLLEANPSDVDLRASVLAYQILLFLGQSIQTPTPLLIEQALTFMQKNLHRQLQVKELCASLGVNEIHLRRQFVRYMNIAPMAYFIKQKLAWSANLLSTTPLTVKQIAYEIGYDDPFYFSNQFKKQFGMSPKQYRTRHPLGHSPHV
jgi:AraC-like DNA-binding protein